MGSSKGAKREVERKIAICRRAAVGRTARNHLKLPSMHIQNGSVTLSEETACALSSIRSQLSANKPSKILGSLSDHVHAYVDASFDDTGYSGVGGELFDCNSTVPYFFFREKIDQVFVDIIKAADQETIIRELEMLALAITVVAWSPKFKGKRLVAFTDIEAVCDSFLRTLSNNRPCNKLLAKVFELEEEFFSPAWLDRAPSQSNPSDELSRSEVAFWRGLPRRSVSQKVAGTRCQHLGVRAGQQLCPNNSFIGKTMMLLLSA